jgi:transposase InsO family protein
LIKVIKEIKAENECDDKLGAQRVREALAFKALTGTLAGEIIKIPCYSTLARIMSENGLSEKKRKPIGLTKADKEAQKADDLLKRNFKADAPCEKWVTDITEIPAKDGKLYISGMFDCYDLMPLAITMDTNMKTKLCTKMLDMAFRRYPELRGSIGHSDRGSQYTSKKYKKAVTRLGFKQSMNSAGGRCHDNARCESVWARFKTELIYGRYDTTKMTVEELKILVWRYFHIYWTRHRICSAIGGVTPEYKRRMYYQTLPIAA